MGGKSKKKKTKSRLLEEGSSGGAIKNKNSKEQSDETEEKTSMKKSVDVAAVMMTVTVKEKQLAEESAAAAKESVMEKQLNEEESGIVPVLSGPMREIARVSVGDFDEGGRWVDDSMDLVLRSRSPSTRSTTAKCGVSSPRRGGVGAPGTSEGRGCARSREATRRIVKDPRWNT